MNQWIDREEFMACTGLKKAGACQAIADKRWKKQPLAVRTEKNPNGGRDKSYVLWDTELNQPATGDDYVERVSTAENKRESDSGCYQTMSFEQGQISDESGVKHNPRTNQINQRKNHAGTELNQPATGENYVSTEISCRRTRVLDEKGEKREENGESVANQILPKKYGLSQKKSDLVKKVPALNQPTTGEHDDDIYDRAYSDVLRKHENRVETQRTECFRASESNEQIAKNAQVRDEKCMDAKLDNIFGDSNVVKISTATQPILSINPAADNNQVQDFTAHYESTARLAEPNPVLPPQAQTAAVDAQNLAVDPETVEVLGESVGFEDLLLRYVLRTREVRKEKLREKYLLKLSNDADFKSTMLLLVSNSDMNGFDMIFDDFLREKVNASERAIYSQNRKKYKETGFIPEMLSGKETRGRNATLDESIAARFKALVIMSVDKNAKPGDRVTQHIRTIVEFQERLQTEFNCLIPYHKLYVLKNTLGLQKYFDEEDGEKKIVKQKSGFPDIPVFDVIQMDGVQTDYFEIGKTLQQSRHIDCIGLLDLGSRRRMAMYGYHGESNKNSVDIFNRLLAENTFPKKPIFFTPDNAPGFKNLKRCLSALNQVYARKDGFVWLDAYARASMPKDKAHIESAHRKFHKEEQHLIRECFEKYPERYVGKITKLRKINDERYKTVTVDIFDITIDEFNGLEWLQNHVKKHNARKGNFSIEIDGQIKRRPWIPEEKFQTFMQTQSQFDFTEEDRTNNEIYGYPTVGKRTVQKDGNGSLYITNDTTDYNIEKSEAVNVGQKVIIRIISKGRVALFEDAADGKFLTMSYGVKAGVKSEKIIKLEDAKKDKAIANSAFKTIFEQFKTIGLFAIEDDLNDLIEAGLTPEIAGVVIQNNSKVSKGDDNEKRLLMFGKYAKDMIEQRNVVQLKFNKGN